MTAAYKFDKLDNYVDDHYDNERDQRVPIPTFKNLLQINSRDYGNIAATTTQTPYQQYTYQSIPDWDGLDTVAKPPPFVDNFYHGPNYTDDPRYTTVENLTNSFSDNKQQQQQQQQQNQDNLEINIPIINSEIDPLPPRATAEYLSDSESERVEIEKLEQLEMAYWNKKLAQMEESLANLEIDLSNYKIKTNMAITDLKRDLVGDAIGTRRMTQKKLFAIQKEFVKEKKYNFSYNCLLHGIAEVKRERKNQIMVEVFNKLAAINCELYHSDICDVHRIGNATPDKPRPILMKFLTRHVVTEILAAYEAHSTELPFKFTKHIYQTNNFFEFY